MQNTALMEMEGILNKIRKRGCSTPSSSSSRVRSHRFKKGILVGKKARGGGGGGGIPMGLGGSRSSTPVPSWSRTVAAAVDSPNYSQRSNGGGGTGRSQSVSARKLAATLWEMNELPTPKLNENLLEEKKSKYQLQKDKSNSNVPLRLSDPTHSPISERMDRSATGSYQRRSSSISQRIPSADNSAGVFDSRSIGNLMEIETRSRAQTPSRSGGTSHLKDISNALTTSKELLKIINRIWAKADQPSANLSLISALHAELERARLQVNQLIQEKKSEQNDVNYLLKRFAEEKAAWRKKECEAVEAAIENIANELEVEKKLRRRFESLNKKIGKELSESKATVLKVEKELEREKRAREILEQVCDELARDSGEDKALVEELQKDAEKVREEVEKEREMLHVADMLREERVQMKLLDAKQQFEEKNSAVDKLRKQLEAFLGKTGKEKKTDPLCPGNGEASSNVFLSRSHFTNTAHEDDEESDDTGEVEDAESELHSLEMNMDNNSTSYKFGNKSCNGDDEAAKWRRKSIAGQMARRCCLPQRSSSDGVQDRSIVNRAESLLGEKIMSEFEKQVQRNSSADEMQRNKVVKDLRNNVLMSTTTKTGGRTGRDFMSSTHNKWDQPWPPQGSSSSNRKSRLADSIVEEGQSAKARRSKR